MCLAVGEVGTSSCAYCPPTGMSSSVIDLPVYLQFMWYVTSSCAYCPPTWCTIADYQYYIVFVLTDKIGLDRLID